MLVVRPDLPARGQAPVHIVLDEAWEEVQAPVLVLLVGATALAQAGLVHPTGGANLTTLFEGLRLLLGELGHPGIFHVLDGQLAPAAQFGNRVASATR